MKQTVILSLLVPICIAAIRNGNLFNPAPARVHYRSHFGGEPTSASGISKC